MSNVLKALLFTFLFGSSQGCSETMLMLQVDTNQVIERELSKGTAHLDLPFTVPANIAESGMTFSVQSRFADLQIELFDPNNNLVATSSSEQGYFIAAQQFSPNSEQNKWGFQKIINPMAGQWMLKFSKNASLMQEDVAIQLSIGLVPKYSAFIKPFDTKVNVGQPTLIQLRLSTHGNADNIEGHSIEVFNERDEQIDSINVSNQLRRADNTRINATESDYLALYTPKEKGVIRLKSTFSISLNDQPNTKEVTNSIEVVDAAISATDISVIAQAKSNGTQGAAVQVTVVASSPIWLVARLTLSIDGKRIDTSRNKELVAGETATFTFDIPDVTLASLNTQSIQLEELEFIDFNVQNSASLLQRITLNQPITDVPLTIDF